MKAYVTVPVEPTDEMVEVALAAYYDGNCSWSDEDMNWMRAALEAAQAAAPACPHIRSSGPPKRATNWCALAAAPQPEPVAAPEWWRTGLAATLMREGINKHRAREIADGYWQAYCQIDAAACGSEG